MDVDDKQQLHRYLSAAREAVTWKVEGLSEYDVRRPLTRTGTNLLGLVRHLSIVEAAYFGATFDRPFAPHLPWWDDDAPEGEDLWVPAPVPRAVVLATYAAAVAHADRTITELDLDAAGRVAWWPDPEVTLRSVLVHVLAETARHAGHLDILREQLDGRTGMREQNLGIEPHDDDWWSAHRDRIDCEARAAVVPD
jgi:uncharacterized damage-inducible protein DinB